MKVKELRIKHEGELVKLLEEKRKRLGELRFSIVRGEVKNVKEVSQVKRDIARILTLMNAQPKVAPEKAQK